MSAVPKPYLIEPGTEYEARYGKPLLITDCEIGHLLDILLDAPNPRTPDGAAAREAIWAKLMATWRMAPPYEAQYVIERAERLCEAAALAHGQ